MSSGLEREILWVRVLIREREGGFMDLKRNRNRMELGLCA